MGILEIQILFWDWRNGKQVACLEESHIEDVTQVSFFNLIGSLFRFLLLNFHMTIFYLVRKFIYEFPVEC